MTWTDRFGARRTLSVGLLATLALWVALVISSGRSSIHYQALLFVGSGLLGCLFGAQLPLREPQPRRACRASVTPLAVDCRTWSPDTPDRRQLLKSALENLANLDALGQSPLMRLPLLSSTHSSGAELRELLVSVLTELTVSPAPRDQEAGRLLLDYYVRRVGSHEVVMERLCLSRPTFYRRLQRGFELIANRLDSINESASRPAEAIG